MRLLRTLLDAEAAVNSLIELDAAARVRTHPCILRLGEVIDESVEHTWARWIDGDATRQHVRSLVDAVA